MEKALEWNLRDSASTEILEEALSLLSLSGLSFHVYSIIGWNRWFPGSFSTLTFNKSFLPFLQKDLKRIVWKTLAWGMLLLLLSRFSRLWLCDPIDCSPPGSPIPGILQARTLEWAAISFSSAWKGKVKVKLLSCPTPSDPMDCSPPGSSVHGILQAREGVGCHCLPHAWGIHNCYPTNGIFISVFDKWRQGETSGEDRLWEYLCKRIWETLHPPSPSHAIYLPQLLQGST